MKKSTMIAAVFAASAFSAFAVDVYSSNIVGYTKVTVAAGFNMLGGQFVEVGTGNPIDINSLVQSSDLAGLDANVLPQSTLKAWTGLGYDIYGWVAAGEGTANGLPEWDSKWVLEDQSAVAAVDVVAGNGFWIQTTAPATITMMGEVSSSNTYSVAVSAGFNMIANPFPMEISIQSVQSTDLAGLDANVLPQSLLKTWTGLGYDIYGWVAAGEGTANGLPEWDSKWVLEDQSAVANVTIGVGQGFWIQTTAPATITFTK